MALTEKQADIYEYIVGFIAVQKYSPSLQQIADRVGLKSLSTVHKHLDNLERKGMIQRDYNSVLSIRVQHGDCPHCFKGKR